LVGLPCSGRAAPVANKTSTDNPLAESGFTNFHPVLSLLHYMLKAPFTHAGTPVVNALFRQKAQIENLLRAWYGTQGTSHASLLAPPSLDWSLNWSLSCARRCAVDLSS
jgi:hypothetical protein